jgi:hypothetical protein
VQISARYQLNGDDGLECLRVHNPSYRKNIVVSAVASAAIIGIGLLYLFLPGSETAPLVTIGIGATILLFSLMQWAYLVQRLRQTWSDMDPIDLLASEAGLVATARGVRSNVEWSRFLRMKEAEKHFLLYTSTDLYNIVPKRGFVSQQDIAAFRQLATQGIGPK